MKLHHKEALEGKAKIEDHAEMLHSKVTPLKDIQEDHAHLKAQCDALTSVCVCVCIMDWWTGVEVGFGWPRASVCLEEGEGVVWGYTRV